MAKTDPPTAAVPTVAEVQQKLAHLQAERAGLAALLDTIPEREAEALEKDAPDSTFQKIDLDRRRAHHKLQRLNARHIELNDQLEDARAVEATAAWVGYVDRYEAIGLEMAAHGRVLAARHAAMMDLVNEAQRAGFSPYAGGPTLPYPPPLHHQAYIEGFDNIGVSLRAARFGRRISRSYTVRFLEWTAVDRTAYLMGQEAGFSAEEGWRLVNAQRAEWVDAADVPPRPARERRPKLPKIPLVEPRIRNR